MSMDGFNLPPGGMGPLDPTDIRMPDEIDTDPDCEQCQEASATPHAYQAPEEDDGYDAVMTGACQAELPSGHLCGDEQYADQHEAWEALIDRMGYERTMAWLAKARP